MNYKKTTPQLLEHIGLQNMKVGEKTNFGRLATIFQYFLRNYQEMGFFPSLHIYKNLPRITVFRKLKCLDAGGSQRMFTKVNSIDKLHTDLAN